MSKHVPKGPEWLFPHSPSMGILQLHSSTSRDQGSLVASLLYFEISLQIQLMPLNALNFESSSVSYSQVIGSLIFDFLIIYLKEWSIQNSPATTVALVTICWLTVKMKGTAGRFSNSCILLHLMANAKACAEFLLPPVTCIFMIQVFLSVNFHMKCESAAGPAEVLWLI